MFIRVSPPTCMPLRVPMEDESSSLFAKNLAFHVLNVEVAHQSVSFPSQLNLSKTVLQECGPIQARVVRICRQGGDKGQRKKTARAYWVVSSLPAEK